MRVLLCHTRYLQRGGEDRSFEEERDLLRAGGHDVSEYVRSNEDLRGLSGFRAAATTVWNRRAAADVARLVDDRRPDVLHVTNSFPLISPSVCRAAHKRGVAVVQALRNYRLLCAGSYLMRDGAPCETCVGKALPLPAIRHRCYRDSAAASAAVVAMQTSHRLLGTWRRHVDAFFTLTEFARSRFLAAGFPADRVHVKYNCVAPDPGAGPGGGEQFVFVGRLSPEKGIDALLDAWSNDPALPPLEIIGDGPLAAKVADAAAADARITWLGELPAAAVYPRIAKARALVIPSVWYETFGRTIAEAFAVGTPVVASALGAMQELVDDGRTGRLFSAGDARDLARAVAILSTAAADDYQLLRTNARQKYERDFTPAQNYNRLIEIYRVACQRRCESPAGRGAARRVATPPQAVSPSR